MLANNEETGFFSKKSLRKIRPVDPVVAGSSPVSVASKKPWKTIVFRGFFVLAKQTRLGCGLFDHWRIEIAESTNPRGLVVG